MSPNGQLYLFLSSDDFRSFNNQKIIKLWNCILSPPESGCCASERLPGRQPEVERKPKGDLDMNQNFGDNVRYSNESDLVNYVSEMDWLVQIQKDNDDTAFFSGVVLSVIIQSQGPHPFISVWV